MTPCGAQTTYDGAPAPLVCTREAGHAPPHAVLYAGLPFASWPTPWTADDQARHVERHTWRKGHVRRPYQTLAMWKAGR